MPINIDTLINKADIEKVSEGLQNVKLSCFTDQHLLSTNNPLLCSNPGDVLKNNATLTADNIKEYMAVCTLVHTIDGWSYLSNAINAYMNGECSITVHLSYYAELRAAIAFLCSEGILVANSVQVCVDNSDNIYIPDKQTDRNLNIHKGTHVATWKILEGWINNNAKSTHVLEYFTYRGITFKELIPHIPYSATSNLGQAAFIKKWLKSWCFDIQKYEGDREGRNASSYNANIQTSFTPSSLKDSLSVLNEFWLLLEPSIDSFSKLDQFLFSLYLTEVYDSITRNGGTSIQKDAFIRDFYNNSRLTEDPILTDIFITGKESSLIRHAKNSQVDLSTGDVFPLTIIARSILLLRLCCGSCSFLFKENDIQKRELDFYINKVGQEFGIWDANPTDLKELWIDISDLLIDFEEYFRNNEPQNMFSLKNTFSEYSDIYTQLSRAGLWGLGL